MTIKAPDNQFVVNDYDLLCNSPCFVFAAQGWADLVEKELVSKNGGYSLDSKCPAISISDFNSNEVLGVATYTEYVNTQNQTYIWVDFVYVKPEARRIGVLGALLEEIDDVAKNKEAKYIEFGTQANNDPMIKASMTYGYEVNSISMRKYAEQL